MARKRRHRVAGYKPGENWVICDRTGVPRRASDVRREWNGLLVDKDDYEPRHPQDLIRNRAERTHPSGEVRSTDRELTTCDKGAVAGIAVAGCAVAGRQSNVDVNGSFTNNWDEL